MIEILPVHDKNIFAIRASGKLTSADYDAFLPQLEQVIKEKGRISLYMELEDFKGWDARAGWRDFRFGMSHDRDFDKIAIVGDKGWERLMVAAANLMTHTRMRFFREDEAEQAWQWLEQKEVRPEDKPVEDYRHILLATDFTRFSKRAGERAKQLAQKYGARLTVLHVLEDVAMYTEDFDVLELEPFEYDPTLGEDLMAIALDNIRKYAGELKLDKSADLQVKWGNPKWMISQYAQDHAADVILMGTHGHRGLDRLLGSISSSVLHQAQCDVLVVK